MHLIFRYTTIYKTQGRLRHFVIGIYMAENCHLFAKDAGHAWFRGEGVVCSVFEGFSFYVLFFNQRYIDGNTTQRHIFF